MEPASSHRPTTAETEGLLQFATDLAQCAGRMIREAYACPQGAYDRKSATDPVTETDREVERYISSEISKRYPSHKFIGEESAADVALSDEPTWIIGTL